ncbi:hypothetical protein DYB25_000765 [Aphanomyces astaci]|uniref:Uncharacterized protein n=1 Tax=Aphanomyces astaci TaxID=112090 RepID=A0A397AU92_APHAT|nr:hypothetical protein DYB25_000765 [Aphanomyces astaci]RHY52491.1 hypothetical protein DYB34_001298 [Aphanomyces astaci]
MFHGDGYAINNLCAANFASTTYLSLVLILSNGPAFHSFQVSYIPWAVAGTAYPGLVLAAYLINAKIAVKVALRSVPESLDVSSTRVQAVAALCVTLDDFDLAACSPEHLISLVTKLSFFQTIRVSDLDGQPLAYALAATWKLVHHVYAVARLEVVAPDDDDLSPAPESVPWHLWVHSATCFESATGRTLLLPTSTEVQDHLQTVFNYAVALIHLPHANARFLVARTLQQMYAVGVGPLPLPTFVCVLCTLAGSGDISPALASSAALTFVRVCRMYNPTTDMAPALASDDLNLTHILGFLGRPKGDGHAAAATPRRSSSSSAEVLAHLVRLVVIQRRQALRGEFANVVQGLVQEGLGGHLPPGDLNGRGQMLLDKFLGMLEVSRTLLLGHLHDSFSLNEVAYVRHLELVVQLQGTTTSVESVA